MFISIYLILLVPYPKSRSSLIKRRKSLISLLCCNWLNYTVAIDKTHLMLQKWAQTLKVSPYILFFARECF
jgi:hypothetical protein